MCVVNNYDLPQQSIRKRAIIMKEAVWEATVEADILNPAFLEQLALEKFDMPQADDNFYYDLDIQFSLVKREFLALNDKFPIVDRPNLRYRTSEDKFADIIGV